MVDQISALDRKQIEGVKSSGGVSLFMAIEALAQLGALHARFLTEFKKHCFLLTIDHLDVSATSFSGGPLRLYGSLIGQTRRAFSYAVQATNEEKTFLYGQLVFAATDYDGRFRREHLEGHYRRIFACLTKDLPGSSH
mgnify:CR=1 FL=1